MEEAAKGNCSQSDVLPVTQLFSHLAVMLDHVDEREIAQRSSVVVVASIILTALRDSSGCLSHRNIRRCRPDHVL